MAGTYTSPARASAYVYTDISRLMSTRHHRESLQCSSLSARRGGNAASAVSVRGRGAAALVVVRSSRSLCIKLLRADESRYHWRIAVAAGLHGEMP